MSNAEEISHLLEKLELLLKRQDDFSKEINNLKVAITKLSIEEAESSKKEKDIDQASQDLPKTVQEETTKVEPVVNAQKIIPKPPVISTKPQKPIQKNDFEKLIGENIINKIGIVILIIGVAIGAKYSIEHDLISPLTRIILGYLMGVGLLTFGFKWKKKYENFSAVLVSGAMAIFYFITYFAYSFYALIPQLLTFALMFVFTVFTVIAAINYNKQIIAHIGLVGAYVVPFLLGDGSGKIVTLFTYIAIINIGILILAFKKYWRALNYTSFFWTWLVFLSWYIFYYQKELHFGLAFVFLFVFFVTFYVITLAYKLYKDQKIVFWDVFLLFSNSFIFYGIGYSILNNNATGQQLLGLFTLFNALVHFIVGLVIYKKKLAEKSLLYLVIGLVLIFITITIPVQLDGNWVTLLWTGEALLLFWIGRTKKIAIYEYISYFLMFLAFVSLLQDWANAYNSYNPEYPKTRIFPIFNIHFLTSILFVCSFGFIQYINTRKIYLTEMVVQKGLPKILSIFIPIILLSSLYFAFRFEISSYWNQIYKDSVIKLNAGENNFTNVFFDSNILAFKSIWIINYSFFFFSTLALVNLKWIKNKILAYVNLGLIAFTLLIFLTQGLFVLSELRAHFLNQSSTQLYHYSVYNLGIRYIAFAFVALALVVCYQHLRKEFLAAKLKIAFDFVLHVTIFWVASSELINWMDFAHSTQSYKLGLSILWGCYAVLLIVLGIWKKKKYLRITAISLFGFTLLKLFLYDIVHLNTIAKTLVFLVLGLLLLVISFLYNKYKHQINNEDAN